MSSWNHRVLRYQDTSGDTMYKFVEVFYDDEGYPMGYGEVFIEGDSPEELVVLADRLAAAALKAALSEDDFVELA